MFLKKIVETNGSFVDACFQLHQSGEILPDSYVIDMDTLRENAKKIYEQARTQNIDVYFMLKQIGRNPVIAKELVKIGYKGAVVVDFKEAEVMMRHNIPIANIGHLVQTPKAMLQKIVDYGCQYYTVFTVDKIRDLNECAKKSGKKISLLLKVVGKDDMIYSGQTAGFRLEELDEAVEEMKGLENVEIKGVTSFPCFLYDGEKESICATNNFETLMTAKEMLGKHGIVVENVNAPSTTSVATLKAMQGYPVHSAEPGHGLTGTTPLHAYKKCEEIPCVAYVSEISHNFDGLAYCYGGGFYRRGHLENALVGNSLETACSVKVDPPSVESIDYYFGLEKPCTVNETVVMAFRFQVFVTRSNVCLVEGAKTKAPKLIGTYNSLGDEITW